MKKRMILALAVLCLIGVGVWALRGPDRTEPVFETAGIRRITFHSTINHVGEVEVPEENAEEIAAWLATFRIGRRAGRTLVPGTGSVSVQIEYADGRIVESNLSTIEMDGVLYLMECGPVPQCYHGLIS